MSKETDSIKKSMSEARIPNTPSLWHKLVHDALMFLLDAVCETMEMLVDTATRGIDADIEIGKQIEGLEKQIKELSQEKKLVARVVEFSIARLEPGPDDVVVFWLPSESDLSHRQVERIAAQFGQVMGTGKMNSTNCNQDFNPNNSRTTKIIFTSNSVIIELEANTAARERLTADVTNCFEDTFIQSVFASIDTGIREHTEKQKVEVIMEAVLTERATAWERLADL